MGKWRAQTAHGTSPQLHKTSSTSRNKTQESSASTARQLSPFLSTAANARAGHGAAMDLMLLLCKTPQLTGSPLKSQVLC